MTPSRSAMSTACVEALGDEREPLLLIDNAVERPQDLVAVAAEDAAFDTPAAGENFYPGRLAPAPLPYVSALVRALDPLIRDGYGLSNVRLGRASCNCALANLPPERLTRAQRIPLVDTVDPLQFAILHYLCGPAFGGTAFYRHRQTGFETLTPERLQPYQAALDEELANAPPPPAYIAGDTAQFERTRLVDAAFNRVVVYRSRLLHSGWIPDATALSADPRRGRLTANIFLTYRAMA